MKLSGFTIALSVAISVHGSSDARGFRGKQPSEGGDDRKLVENLDLIGEEPDEFLPAVDVPTLAPSKSPAPSGGPSDVPSGVPSSAPSQQPSDGSEGRKMGLEDLSLFGENPEDFTFPTLAPSESPKPSGAPSGVPSGVPIGAPSDGSEGRMLGASAITGTLILPADSALDESGAPSLAPSASSAPSDVPSLAPSASPGPSGGPSDVPSGVPSGAPSDGVFRRRTEMLLQ